METKASLSSRQRAFLRHREAVYTASLPELANSEWTNTQSTRVMTRGNDTALLDELMEPLGRCLTPDTARQIVQLRAPSKLEVRIHELTEKSSEGTLTPDERAQYETIVRFVKFVSILQSKARRLIKDG